MQPLFRDIVMTPEQTEAMQSLEHLPFVSPRILTLKILTLRQGHCTEEYPDFGVKILETAKLQKAV